MKKLKHYFLCHRDKLGNRSLKPTEELERTWVRVPLVPQMKSKKIKKCDLVIEGSTSFSYSSFPKLQRYNLGDPSFEIKIGSFTVAKIVVDFEGKWHVSNVFSKYKSFDNAIKSILKRLNETKKTCVNENSSRKAD